MKTGFTVVAQFLAIPCFNNKSTSDDKRMILKNMYVYGTMYWYHIFY